MPNFVIGYQHGFSFLWPRYIKQPFMNRILLNTYPLILAAVLLRNQKAEPPESDTDARIAFYSARAAGRGSYPAYARLGAVGLDQLGARRHDIGFSGDLP